MWDRRAEYVDNHDGDNATMILDQGFYDTKRIEVRLNGVWAPELKQPGGPDCQVFVRNWFHSRLIKPRWNFVVWTTPMPRADRELKTLDRYVANITSMDPHDSLNSAIAMYCLERGYGRGTGG